MKYLAHKQDQGRIRCACFQLLKSEGVSASSLSIQYVSQVGCSYCPMSKQGINTRPILPVLLCRSLSPVRHKEKGSSFIEIKKVLACIPGSCPIHVWVILSLSLSHYPFVISFSCPYWHTHSLSLTLPPHNTCGNNRNPPYLYWNSGPAPLLLWGCGKCSHFAALSQRQTSTYRYP